MPRPGRPMGPILIAVLDRLKEKHMTAREVAHELQLSIEAATNACRRLHEAEMIVVRQKIKIDGIKKPVCLYAAAFDPKPAPALMAANVFAKQRK